RGNLLFELEVLIDTIRFGPLEGRDRDRDVKWRARASQLVDETHELNGIEIDHRARRLGAVRARGRIVAGEGEDVVQPERGEVFQRLAQAAPVLTAARQVDVRGQAAGARGSADAERIVTERTARVAGHAAGDYLGHPRQAGGD